MGSFYTNITLRTTDIEAVAAALRDGRRTALIAPPDRGCTVVYDRASEEQDIEALQALAMQLSRACACPALAVLNHDDDLFLYSLYDGGKLVDEYNSGPGYFADEGDGGDTGPSGGDAGRLARTFQALDRAATVERILRAPSDAGDGYVFATDRHRDLVQALGLPAAAVGTGYAYLEQGELPDGLDASRLRRV
jgi:hypothetical protein